MAIHDGDESLHKTVFEQWTQYTQTTVISWKTFALRDTLAIALSLGMCNI